MEILIKLKDDSKFNAIASSIGTFRKGTVYAIDSSNFDESIMNRVDEKTGDSPTEEVEKVDEMLTKEAVEKIEYPEEKPKIADKSEEIVKPVKMALKKAKK